MSNLTGFSVPAPGAEGFPATAVPADADGGRVALQFQHCAAGDLALLARRLRVPHWTALRAMLVEALPDAPTSRSKRLARALCNTTGARSAASSRRSRRILPHGRSGRRPPICTKRLGGEVVRRNEQNAPAALHLPPSP